MYLLGKAAGTYLVMSQVHIQDSDQTINALSLAPLRLQSFVLWIIVSHATSCDYHVITFQFSKENCKRGPITA